MSPPSNYDQLRAELQERMPAMAAGQQRIARLVLSDPDGTALRSIGETAERAEVHQSSLVRFAKLLGLPGYPALVELCREQLTTQARLVTRFGQAQQHHDSGDLLAETVEHEQRNLQRSFSRIEARQWETVVGWLADAERVHVLGFRKCLPVAQLAAYLLRLVRPGVHQIAPVTGGLVDELRDLAEGEVFLAVSIHPYTEDTVRAFAEAQRRGLRTVAFTDTAASPLARIAEETFLLDCAGVTILRSVASMVSLAQALATAVALRRGTSSREDLVSDERLLTEFGIYHG
ncbi:MurR/RpiR family transcriptional regulator [Sciscionella sediminilitoris]|uniref:MurR/RpiR family transcriptional regulator n=1 Tax=Sciscionella sediminilitoris TaxID=1445613 RepID=UPI0004DF8EC3|nr:MurR/RpiR family transcriptional regulator [Sciscionella sp. SE31]